MSCTVPYNELLSLGTVRLGYLKIANRSNRCQRQLKANNLPQWIRIISFLHNYQVLRVYNCLSWLIQALRDQLNRNAAAQLLIALASQLNDGRALSV